MLCRYPIYNKTVGGITRCGQCLHCRIHKRREKVARFILESWNYDIKECLFVTLTYDESHLPLDYVCPSTGEFFASPGGVLNPRQFQLFCERLRERCRRRGIKIRYFGVGEYGEKTARPHYHMLIFGLSLDKSYLVRDCWIDVDTKEPLCDPARLDIQIPRSEHDVASYCSGYVVKKMTKPDDPRLEGRYPEFFRSSKGVGISGVDVLVHMLSSSSAREYISDNLDIPRSFTVNGKSYPIDRYLRSKILERLEITDEVMEEGRKKFKEEMSLLRVRGETDAFPKKAFPSLSFALQSKFLSDKSQQMKNVEVKRDIFTKEKQ